MPITIDRPAARHPLLHKLLWFVGLWAAGVLTVGVVAMALRWLLQTA